MNIASPLGYLSASSSVTSSGASSTSSSKDILNTHSPKMDMPPPSPSVLPQQQPQVKLARNKLLENNSLASSSQGYHSDTWESHSSRQSFDMEQKPAPGVAPARYKHFNKISSKLAAESKLAKTSILTSATLNHKHMLLDANGSTSDGSINGLCSGDDTDSMPANPANQCYKNILIEKPSNSTCSSASTSSNSSTSSAAAISGATTLSSTSSNSFSAAVAAVIQTNHMASINSNCKPEAGVTVNRLSSGPIELPIYYQSTDKSHATEANKQLSFNGSYSLNQSINNSDLYA